MKNITLATRYFSRADTTYFFRYKNSTDTLQNFKPSNGADNIVSLSQMITKTIVNAKLNLH
jgi:hypothetical protein